MIDVSGFMNTEKFRGVDWVDKKGNGRWEWKEEIKSEAAAKEQYGQNARYAESGYPYNTSDGRQVVLQDQGNWSYTSQKIDPDCPSCGLNNGNTGWVEQFQEGIKSYMPLLKASEIMLTADVCLLAGMIAPEAALVTRGTQTVETGAQVGKTVTNIIPEGKLANHLFNGAGKLADNTANRALIQKISNGKTLGVDAYGKTWYTGVDAAGKSIYSYTQNGIVKGAGSMTMTAKEMIIKYGLK